MRKFWLIGLCLFSCVWAARLEITAGQTKIYTAKDTIQRIINADPELVTVTQTAPTKLTVYAKNIGVAKVYFWTDKQDVLLVQVSGKKSALSKPRTPGKNNGRYEMYFKYDPANSTPVNQRMFIQSLEYRWQTLNDLTLDFQARYKQNAISAGEDTGQIERASVRLAKNNNYLQIGDDTIRYSELVAPYLEMQGITGRLRLGSFILDGFAGRRPGNYWGSEIVENYIQAKDKDVDVGGGRLTWLAGENLDLSYTAVNRTADKNNLLGSYSGQSGDLKYRYGAYLFNYELASTEEDKNKASAQRGELNYDAEDYGWQIAYRDVAPDFRSVADYFNYGGMQGWSLYGRANPSAILSLSGSYENYLQRFDRNVLTNPDYTVERLRLQMGFNRITFFRPFFMYHANYRDGYRSHGLTAQLYEIELWRRWLWAYTSFSAWRYDTPYAEYTADTTLAGLSLRRGWFTGKAEQVKTQTRYVLGGESLDTQGWNFILNFGEFDLYQNIKLTLSLWQQTRKNNLDTLDKKQTSARLRLGQAIGDFYWYLNGVATRENSLFYEYEGEKYDRNGYFYHEELVQSEISGGLVYRF